MGGRAVGWVVYGSWVGGTTVGGYEGGSMTVWWVVWHGGGG